MTTELKSLDTIYRELLATVHCAPNTEGFIYKTTIGDASDKTPVIVQKKQLVFPTKEQLAQPDWSNRFAFHPMVEDFSSGFSPVFDDYRRRVSHMLNVCAQYLMLHVADMATKDGAYQKSLPQNVADYLRYVKEGDQKFRDIIFGIITADAVAHKADMEFIRVNVQKGRKIDGVQRKRSAHISFPLLEKVLSHTKENKVDSIAGVNGIRGKDREMIRSLYKLMFPLAETSEQYVCWSDSMQAPSMDALMRGVAPVIEHLNTIIVTLNGHVPGMPELIIPYNWKSVFDNLDAYSPVFSSIPMLNGNTGSGRVVDPVVPPTIQIPTKEQALAMVAAQPTEGRVVTTSVPATTPATAPAQPIVLNAPVQSPVIKIDTQMQPTVTASKLTTVRLDGPRGGALEQPAQQPTQQPVAQQVAKHDPVTMEQITQQSQPLFGNVPTQQPVQQPVAMAQAPNATALPQLPPGQPTPVQTQAGIVYVYPNGQTFTQQQIQAVQAAQAQAAQTQGLQGLAALGNNPAMQQLIAMNPQNAMLAAGMAMTGTMPGMVPGMMPGMVPGMMPGIMPGMMPGVMPQQMQQAALRMPGAPYQPLTPVQQVIPSYGGF